MMMAVRARIAPLGGARPSAAPRAAAPPRRPWPRPRPRPGAPSPRARCAQRGGGARVEGSRVLGNAIVGYVAIYCSLNWAAYRRARLEADRASSPGGKKCAKGKDADESRGEAGPGPGGEP